LSCIKYTRISVIGVGSTSSAIATEMSEGTTSSATAAEMSGGTPSHRIQATPKSDSFHLSNRKTGELEIIETC
jgi:hypothetical protein